jgi:hypothetical protein
MRASRANLLAFARFVRAKISGGNLGKKSRGGVKKIAMAGGVYPPPPPSPMNDVGGPKTQSMGYTL